MKTSAKIAAEMAGRMDLMRKVPVCPGCGYPVREGPCGECAAKAAREADEAQRKRERDIVRLGGLKAFEDFTMESYDDRQTVALCHGYPNVNLYLWGPAGCGKTHLATAIISRQNHGTVLKPMHIYRQCRGLKDGEQAQAAIDRIAAMPHLVIDDLGADKSTEYSISTLYEIIEARDMNKVKGLIITSNLSLNALAEKLGDDRVTSRIKGMSRVLEMKGRDRRGS